MAFTWFFLRLHFNTRNFYYRSYIYSVCSREPCLPSKDDSTLQNDDVFRLALSEILFLPIRVRLLLLLLLLSLFSNRRFENFFFVSMRMKIRKWFQNLFFMWLVQKKIFFFSCDTRKILCIIIKFCYQEAESGEIIVIIIHRTKWVSKIGRVCVNTIKKIRWKAEAKFNSEFVNPKKRTKGMCLKKKNLY